MTKDATWVSTRISEAHKTNPSINEMVLKNIENFLKTQLSERQLSTKELAEIARALLAANVPAPRQAETEK